MLDLGIIVPVITNRSLKKCIIIIYDGHYSIILSGPYHDEEILTTKTLREENNILLHISEDILMFNEIVLTNEIKDVYHKTRILTENLDFIEIDKKNHKEIINKYLKRCSTKKNVGFKATIDTFNKATLDFVIDKTQFSLEGPIDDRKVMVDIKGDFCFRISNEMSFLSYLLDSIYIDLSSVIPYEESISQLKHMANILISNHNYKLSSSYKGDKTSKNLKK